RHNECPVCDFDGETWDELLDHCREEGCRTVCRGCDGGHGSHWESECDAYWEHLDEHNVCTQCERHFSTPDNLTHHRLTHCAATYECLGCDRKFKTYGGMIIHLEYGTCDSGVDHLDLNATAAECRMWSHFIDEDYREDMLDSNDLQDIYSDKVYPYKCPTCDAAMPKLSSLFQHVESPACGQTLNEGAIGRLRRFLYSRYG
ncbi:hypothetical protein BU26DRAFT_421026, partial [Trematosphaeria pertusa]